MSQKDRKNNWRTIKTSDTAHSKTSSIATFKPPMIPKQTPLKIPKTLTLHDQNLLKIPRTLTHHDQNLLKPSTSQETKVKPENPKDSNTIISRTPVT